MDETLRQLGVLVLGSIPTIILFLILFATYRSLVHKPLQKVLAERRARTEGALEKARADIAAAEARTAEYERNLREAQMTIFKLQETQRQAALQARSRALAEVRSLAGARVEQAKASLADEVNLAKGTMQVESERLSSEIIQSILRQVRAAHLPAGGAE
jgi:F-type H+-transporting ATPase subunit b